jgi:hypothetical protein
MQESTVTGYKLKVAGWGAVVPLLMLAILTGCSPKEADQTANAGTGSAQPTETVAAADDSDLLLRVRFAGTTALMADTNAAYLTDIAALPETAVLGKRLVERFASLPGLLVARGLKMEDGGSKTEPTPGLTEGGKTNNTSPHPTLSPPQGAERASEDTKALEPFLADLLRDGFALELRGDSNGVSHMVLGTKTDTEQATRWNSALAAAAKAWFGEAVGEGKASWSAGQGRMQVRGRDGGLTLGLSSGTNLQPSTFNVQPKSSSASAVLEVEMACTLLPGPIQRSQYGGFHRLSFAVTPTSKGFQIRGEADYLKDLPSSRGTFALPTNLITEPSVSLTLVRHPGGWLEAGSSINAYLPKPIPDVAFLWGGQSSPYQLFLAMPLPSKKLFSDELAPKITNNLAKLVQEIGTGNVAFDAQKMEIQWQQVPFTSPTIRVESSADTNYLVAGVFPQAVSELGINKAFTDRVSNNTNLLLLDWEFTQARIDTWFGVGQLALFVSKHNQVGDETASVKWLKAAQKVLENGGNMFTEISQMGPRELTLDRLAPLGFSSIELFWLANWLESPNFPRANFLTPMPQPDWGTGGQSEPTTTTPQGE